MKNMKLIMENFKKSMDESWSWGGSKQDSEDFVQKQLAKQKEQKKITAQAVEMSAETVRQEILDLYDNQYENVQDIVDDEATELDIGKLKVMLNRTFGDAHAQLGGNQGIEAAEEDMLKMFDILGVLEDDEEDGLMPSDYDDPPGYMPGEGGNY